MIHEEHFGIEVIDPATGQRVRHVHTIATEVEPQREYEVQFRGCRRHRHRTDAAEAKCIWRYAEWIAGSGRWATLAGCGVLTVVLHESKAKALASLAAIDTYGCGHRCPVNVEWKRHRLVYLTKPKPTQRPCAGCGQPLLLDAPHRDTCEACKRQDSGKAKTPAVRRGQTTER